MYQHDSLGGLEGSGGSGGVSIISIEWRQAYL